MDILMIALLILIAATASFAWLARHWHCEAQRLEGERDAAIAHITAARGLGYDSGFARGERSMASEMVRAAVYAVCDGRDPVAAIKAVARLSDEPVEALSIQV
jgi:hypothetical protein